MRASVVVLALVGCIATERAWAQGPTNSLAPEARAHLEAGLRDFEARAYESAISEFREGYRIQPHPDFLYALAQAQRMNGDCAHAVENYGAFLGTNPPPKEAEVAQFNMGRCQPLLTAPPASAAPAATPAVTAPVVATLPPPDATLATARPWYRDPLGMTLLGAGAAGAGVAATFFLVANGQANAANQAPTLGDYEQHASDAARSRTIAIVAGATGAALLVVALVRFALSSGPHATHAATIKADGASVSVRF